jgi:hypothetical protein
MLTIAGAGDYANSHQCPFTERKGGLLPYTADETATINMEPDRIYRMFQDSPDFNLGVKKNRILTALPY